MVPSALLVVGFNHEGAFARTVLSVKKARKQKKNEKKLNNTLKASHVAIHRSKGIRIHTVVHVHGEAL